MWDKILEEIEMKKEKCLDIVRVEIDPMEIAIHREQYKGLRMAEDIIRKHMNDGWIPMEERLPEDLYTSSELYEKWFLITTPCGEEKLVQRMKCVPSGYVWHDGYDTHRAVAWGYIEPYKPKRREKS